MKPCVVKRDAILSFKLASEILKTMMENSDSDAADRDTSSTKIVLMQKGTNSLAMVKENPNFKDLHQPSNVLPITTHTITSAGMVNVHNVSVCSNVQRMFKITFN